MSHEINGLFMKKKEFTQGLDANTTAKDFWLGAIG
jgi:hypothetical protein